MIRLSKTRPWRSRSVSNRSSTINFTLLSDSLAARVTKLDAAAISVHMHQHKVEQNQGVGARITFDSSGVLRKRREGRCRLVFNRMRGCTEQFEHGADISRLSRL